MKRYAKTNTVVVTVIITLAIILAIVAGVRVSRQGQQGSGLSSEYQFDLSALGQVDPNLILFTQTGEVKTGFVQARAVAVDAQGTLWVSGDKALKRFDDAGEHPLEMTVEPFNFVPLTDVIYVASLDEITVLNHTGEVLQVWPSLGERSLITSLAVDESYVYIADYGQRVVWLFDRQGTLIRRIGEKDADRNIPGFVIPSRSFDLALAPDGLLRVVNPGNHRIEAYTQEGDLELAWGEFGRDIEQFTGCCNPANIAVLSDGSFVTCEKGIVRVKLYESDGRFVGVVAGPAQLVPDIDIGAYPAAAFDVAVDAEGRVYVLDTIKNRVRIFSRK